MIIFNQYIKVPIYWFSRLPHRYKLILISVYIILVPISPVYILLVNHILIILLWILEFKPYPILYRKWAYTIILLYIVYFVFALIISSNQMISICIPYNIKISSYFLNLWNVMILNKQSLYCNTYSIYKYFYLDIPFLLTRNYLLLLNYFNLYNFIKLTTSQEQLIVNLINLVQYNKHKWNPIQASIIIVLLSSEIISTLNSRLINTKNCFMLRGLNMSRVFIDSWYLIQLILYKYKKYIITIIHNTVYVIYSRELLVYDIDLWLLI
uniref:Uncharacterized protein n=1 Tax=Neoizziella asiatica TaxID=1077397 RepID=A0A1G4NWU1_9FLOR|nr:Hypothetical protein ORF_5 [Neoizziella asiatica]SCW23173.1 Hypothetical protein ORF_5 [Neoizziella asiatica]